MHTNKSRFCAMILFIGRLKCVVQIIIVDVGNQLVSNRLLNCFADRSKIRNRAIVGKLRMIQGRLLKDRA